MLTVIVAVWFAKLHRQLYLSITLITTKSVPKNYNLLKRRPLSEGQVFTKNKNMGQKHNNISISFLWFRKY